METQEIINQVKQENQENDIIMSNQEIKEKVRQQMNKTKNSWLDTFPEIDGGMKELFRKEYYGIPEANSPDPCKGCSNKGKVCHCILGSMVIEA